MNNIERADKAKAVLESPVFAEAFDMVRNKLLEGIENCPIDNVSLAEDFRRCLRLLKSVRGHLETAINSGKLDKAVLDEVEKRKKNPLRGLFR